MSASQRKDIIRRNPDGSIDEIIAYDLEYVHVEQMDDGHWWVGLGKRLGQPLLHIHFTSRRKITVEVVE